MRLSRLTVLMPARYSLRRPFAPFHIVLSQHTQCTIKLTLSWCQGIRKFGKDLPSTRTKHTTKTLFGVTPPNFTMGKVAVSFVLAFCFLALANAFAPSTTLVRSTTELAAGRREVIGAVGVALGGLLAGQATAGATEPSILLAGLKNPAGETFKARKGPSGSFVPGKGIRAREDELLAGLKNPAGETFKARKGPSGSFVPGKGIRAHDDELLAGLKNPAGETFKARKGPSGSFVPGKGIRAREDGLMAGLTNPAGETFKSRKGHGRASFIPGKGMRLHEDELMAGLTNPAGETFKSRKGHGRASFIPGKGMRVREDELMA